MQYFLGVDAGGTKTEFLLGDEARELARVRTGTIKRMRASEETTEANLVGALRHLTDATGISMQSITRCCIGTAGDAVPLVVDWLRQAFAHHVGGELILVSDVEVALDAAFHGKRGVLVLAGTGSNVAGRAGTGSIVTAGGKGNACAWGDYDNDGYLDLYVCNADQNNFLYHNNGNGTFTRITTGPAVVNTGNSQGCAWGDYDNDGYLDLFVTRSGANSLLLHNNRNGTFTLVTNGPVANDNPGGPCAWGDYDNDGFLDLIATGTTNHLYHNNGDGTFTRVSTGIVVTDPVGYNGCCAWADYDNDGWLDLFIPIIGAQNLLYHNNGDGTFTKITSGSVVNDGNALCCAWADIDKNGFPDLFTGGASVPGHVYRNNGNSNNWLAVQCLGRVSNRSAIGTKIRVQATIHGRTVRQLREISGGGDLGCQNEMSAGFGLGDATNAEVVRIEWPSGIVQEFSNVATKQFFTVKEESKLAAAMQMPGGNFQLTLTGGKGLVYSLESSTDLDRWTQAALLTNQIGIVTWTNQLSLAIPALFFRSQEQ